MEEKVTKVVEVLYDTSGNHEVKVEITEPMSPDVQKQFEKIWGNQ